MKKIFLLLFVSLILIPAKGQAPEGFNYQAVARDGNGNVLADTPLHVRIGILDNGELVWQEDHAIQTNAFGLFTITVGSPDADKSGGSLAGFKDIDWGTGSYEIEVSVDDGDGFVNLGSAPLMSVPYAMHAGNDADEQQISLEGTFLSIENGNSVDLSGIADNISKIDADSTNEIQNLDLTGTTLSIEKGNSVDLSVFQNEENADNDSTNELQSLAIDGYELSLSNSGGNVSLPIDSTDEIQALSIDGQTLSLSKNGGSIELPAEMDGDPENELQDLSYSEGVLSLSNDPTPTVLNLPQVVRNNQAWSISADTIHTNNSVGIGTSTPSKSLLAIQSLDPQVEEPLFEVRNDAGNPVFAVYNDGVIVYVDENKKGVKGGFAVGGYNSASKGVTQEYLRITPDSVRIYVPETVPAKGVKGGFAVGGYNSGTKGSTVNFLEVTSTSTNILFDTTNQAKGVKGGFAVGGYNSASKGVSERLMSLTRKNYLIGTGAGDSITTGENNTFFGWKSGHNTTTGRNNIFLGSTSGFNNIDGLENIFIGNSSGYNTEYGYGNVFLGNESGYLSTGGYYNSFLGYQTGYNATAHYNTFLGYQAGYNNTTGLNNIAIGFKSGYGYPESGDGVTGNSNVFMGYSAGYRNTSGSNNIFLGLYTGYYNTSGANNIFIGNQTGQNSENGNFNTFIGYQSGYFSGYNVATDPSYNTFLGYQTGYSNTTGQYNTYVGYNAGFGGTNGSGSNNVMIGKEAGYSNITGTANVFIGESAGYANQDGSYNTLLGYNAGHDLNNGYKNVVIGYRAGYKIRDNRYNIIIGEDAGYNLAGVLGDISSGQANLLMGLYAGRALTTGSKNIFLGLDTGFGCDPDAQDNVWIGLAAGRSSASSGSVFIGKYAGYSEDSDNKLIIQTNYTGTDNLSQALVYGDFTTKYFRHNGNVGVNHLGDINWALTVGMDAGDNFGLVVYGPTYSSSGTWDGSDLRLKKNVVTYSGALQKVLSMRGVSFNWRSDEFPDRHYSTENQIGVIAQEVEEVVPELVSEGPEGYKSVDYSKIAAVLIEAVKEQQNQIEELQQRIEELEAGR